MTLTVKNIGINTNQNKNSIYFGKGYSKFTKSSESVWKSVLKEYSYDTIKYATDTAKLTEKSMKFGVPENSAIETAADLEKLAATEDRHMGKLNSEAISKRLSDTISILKRVWKYGDKFAKEMEK